MRTILDTHLMKGHERSWKIINPRFVNAIDDAYFNEAAAASLAALACGAVRFHRCLIGVISPRRLTTLTLACWAISGKASPEITWPNCKDTSFHWIWLGYGFVSSLLTAKAECGPCAQAAEGCWHQNCLRLKLKMLTSLASKVPLSMAQTGLGTCHFSRTQDTGYPQNIQRLGLQMGRQSEARDWFGLHFDQFG